MVNVADIYVQHHHRSGEQVLVEGVPVIPLDPFKWSWQVPHFSNIKNYKKCIKAM